MLAAFKAADTYSATFEDFRQFYTENELTDIDNIKQQDHGLLYFNYEIKMHITLLTSSPVAQSLFLKQFTNCFKFQQLRSRSLC